MKNRFLTVLLLPLLTAVFAFTGLKSNSDYRTYTPKDSSYVVSYPSTWDAHRGRKSFQLMLISPRTDSSDSFQENVIIFREDAGSKNISQYADYIINEKLPNSVKDFKLLSKTSKKINKLNAVRLVYSFNFRKPAKSLAYIFLDDGFAYVVLGTALESTFSKYEQNFDHIGKSFKFIRK
jgi:hypothetical protein